MFNQKTYEQMLIQLHTKNYQLIKQINKGTFGSVHLAKNIQTNIEYAIKLIYKQYIKTIHQPQLMNSIIHQLDKIKQINHPNLLKYEQYFQTSGYIIIVMEYCQMGNVYNYQAKLPDRCFELKKAIKIVIEVLKGLKCIHQVNLIHRHIKMQNILMKMQDGQIRYKIGYFGFIRKPMQKERGNRFNDMKRQVYLAPQLLDNLYYGISVDMWALGVCFYFMLFKSYPFNFSEIRNRGRSMKELIDKQCSKQAFSLSRRQLQQENIQNYSTEVQDLFRKIFIKDIKKRMTFSNIIKHPVFNKYENEFKQNVVLTFYLKFQLKQQYIKDQPQQYREYPHNMAYNIQNAYNLNNQFLINKQQKHNMSIQLRQVYFEIDKITYLKDCALLLHDDNVQYLTYSDKLAAKFYLLKTYLMYSRQLINHLVAGAMPQSMEQQTGIQMERWMECTRSIRYHKLIQKLKQEYKQTYLFFKATYNEIAQVQHDISIDNFYLGYTQQLTQTSFNDLKLPYRSTMSYIYLKINRNSKINSQIKYPMMMRLFCCHMINRIFNRKDIGESFPFYVQWLENKNIKEMEYFDFRHFKKWLQRELVQKIKLNIKALKRQLF